MRFSQRTAQHILRQKIALRGRINIPVLMKGGDFGSVNFEKLRKSATCNTAQIPRFALRLWNFRPEPKITAPPRPNGCGGRISMKGSYTRFLITVCANYVAINFASVSSVGRFATSSKTRAGHVRTTNGSPEGCPLWAARAVPAGRRRPGEPF